MRLLNLIFKVCEERQYKHSYLKRMDELMNDLSDRTRAGVTCHTRPVISEQLEHQKVQRQYPREHEQYHQRAKMEKQERMKYLRQPTS